MPRLAHVRLGCPYKKTYFNWSTGKAEKCILCYPRLESGQPPACFHSCVGRIRYIGLLLYDADAIEEAARAPQKSLVQAQRDVIKDPFDPEVIAAAKASGIPIRRSTRRRVTRLPVRQKVETRAAAASGVPHPAHAVLCAAPRPGARQNRQRRVRQRGLGGEVGAVDELAGKIARVAALYGEPVVGGNEQIIRDVYRKLVAVRVYMRAKNVKDIPADEVERALAEGKTNPAGRGNLPALLAAHFRRAVRRSPHGARHGGRSMFPVLDPVSRNYPVHKGAVGTGFHINPQRGP